MAFRTLTRCAFAAALLSLALALTREEATRAGVAYFAGLCAKQQAAYAPLLRSIGDRDLSGAIRHYVAARPFYEEIETLANSFEAIDADIDARPYVFALGEDSKSFRGFHVLERLLYRDQNVTGAHAPARALGASIDALCAALAEPARFSPRKSWAGLLALALEVPAKKISSEEETWSDLSLMIFRSNFRGIYSQYAPFATVPGVSAAATAAVERVYGRIVALFDELDPENGFAGKPSGAAKPYSSVSVAQRRAILEHAYAFHAALAAVHEEVFRGLPEPPAEAEPDEPDEQVVASVYRPQVAAGLAYFAAQCAVQQKSAAALHAVLRTGDLAGAKAAYNAARPPYEQIETLAGDFEEEDTEIDARPYAHDGGETNPDFVGFHKVERALYRDADVMMAEAAMPRLRSAIDSLCAKLAEPHRFSADSQWKGVLALVYEVPAKKIASEEETWSDLSVMIFRENAKGIYSQVKPYFRVLPAHVVEDVEGKFKDIKDMFVYDVDRDNTWDGINFKPYSSVPVWQRKSISDKFYALGRSLINARAHLTQAKK